MVILFVCPGGLNKIPQTGQLQLQKFILVSHESPILGCRRPPSLCLHVDSLCIREERERGPWGPLPLVRTAVCWIRAPPLWPHLHPRNPFSQYSHSGLQHRNSVGHSPVHHGKDTVVLSKKKSVTSPFWRLCPLFRWLSGIVSQRRNSAGSRLQHHILPQFLAASQLHKFLTCQPLQSHEPILFLSLSFFSLSPLSLLSFPFLFCPHWFCFSREPSYSPSFHCLSRLEGNSDFV